MNSNQFREYGQEMVEYLTGYLDSIDRRRVVSAVEPGYLAPLLPKEAPVKGEDFQVIMKDLEEKIMPGTFTYILSPKTSFDLGQRTRIEQ